MQGAQRDILEGSRRAHDIRSWRKVREKDMVDRVATVVRLERLGMLEVEDEVRRVCGETWLITIAKDLTSSPFSAHTGGCAGLVEVS